MHDFVDFCVRFSLWNQQKNAQDVKNPPPAGGFAGTDCSLGGKSIHEQLVIRYTITHGVDQF